MLCGAAIGYQLSAIGYRRHLLTLLVLSLLKASRTQVAEACTTKFSYATHVRAQRAAPQQLKTLFARSLLPTCPFPGLLLCGAQSL